MYILAGGIYELKNGAVVTVVNVLSGQCIVCSNLTGSTYPIPFSLFKDKE